MDEILFGVLAERVVGYLDTVDKLTSASNALSTDAQRMVAAWRALLKLHHPVGARGHCGGCAAGRHFWRGRGRRAAMCTVWRVAHAYFVRRLPGEGSGDGQRGQ
ncbi:hypothetical protein EV193_106169 [Herbihabitans rhizosphaerae]|uniref:Uncharacterized protein n=1 Tax=Herbihabitans rhizosphaerae TaxID=1872711 RepID=A0A4Q7KKE4_9PSEU|nr:hypothetical protein [Herbihabitans rhizosphaerae]RZS36935.1 hypothetical protein EV193_106169 [Herbihabitans rhizosphaerae]